MKTQDYPDAEARRDIGIADSAEHAEFDMPGWLDDAVTCVGRYAGTRRGETFLAEDARYWARLQGLPNPPEQRAWGAVIRRAHREGHIERVGYGPARSSNLSPKILWLAL
jgi:hypothetical protein